MQAFNGMFQSGSVSFITQLFILLSVLGVCIICMCRVHAAYVSEIILTRLVLVRSLFIIQKLLNISRP